MRVVRWCIREATGVAQPGRGGGFPGDFSNRFGMEIITADLNDYLRIYLRTYPPPVSFLPRSTAIFEEQLVNNVIFFRAFIFFLFQIPIHSSF